MRRAELPDWGTTADADHIRLTDAVQIGKRYAAIWRELFFRGPQDISISAIERAQGDIVAPWCGLETIAFPLASLATIGVA